MGKRSFRHPEALRQRLYDESVARSQGSGGSWRPPLRYWITLRRRDGGREFKPPEPTLEAARAEVQRYFDFDVDDVYECAWIREEIVLNDRSRA